MKKSDIRQVIHNNLDTVHKMQLDYNMVMHQRQQLITEEPKQETLEEAIKREYETRKFNSDFPFDPQSFKLGAKWAQERMYSDEDIKLAFEAGYKKGFSGYPNTENWKELTFNEWFEQFKEK